MALGVLACTLLSACNGGGGAPATPSVATATLQLNPSPLELTSDTPSAVITAQGDVAGVQYTPHADPACVTSTGSIAIAGDGVAQTDVAGSPLMFIAVATGTPPASCNLTVSGSDGSGDIVEVDYSVVTLSSSLMNATHVQRVTMAGGTFSPSSVTIDKPTSVASVSASGFNGETTSSVACNGTSHGTGISVIPSSFTSSGTITIAPFGQGALAGTCTVTFTDSSNAKAALTVTLAAAALPKLTITPNNVQFSCAGTPVQTCTTGNVNLAETSATQFRINTRPTLINSCANLFNGPLQMTTGNGTFAQYVTGPQASVSFYGSLLSPSLSCKKIVIGDGNGQTVAVFVNGTLASGGTAAIAPSCAGPDSHVAAPNAPHGIYVWNPYKVDGGKWQAFMQKYVLGNGTTPLDPNICGVSIVVPWSDIEPTNGNYYWNDLDGWIAPYAHVGLRVNLLIADASEVGANNTATPQWITSPIVCPSQPPYPNWTDATFEQDYESAIDTIVKHFTTGQSGADQYAPNVGYIRFGIGAGVESYPGHLDDPCLKAWAQVTPPGFSYNAWLQHSLNIEHFLAKETPKTDKQLMVSLNYIQDPSAPNNAYAYSNAMAAVAAPNKIAFGTQNLGINAGNVPVAGANTQPHACDPTRQYVNVYWCQAYTRHVGVVPFEFQPIVSPIVPDGHDVTIAHLFQYGMDNNAQIFEIYPQDWVFANDPNDAADFPGFSAATRADYQAAFSATSLLLGRNH